MQLFLDRGNSSVKWGAWQDGWQAGGRLPLDAEGHVAAAALAELPAAHSIWLASVARDERDAALVEQLESARELQVQRIVTEAEAAGVRCAYAEPWRLGVDRWLAVIAAYEPGSPAVVVDAGTAITIDAVSGDGRHLGGLIAPGIGLMRSSLYANTDRIPDEDDALDEGSGDLLGRETRSAVSSGTLHAAAGLVDRVVARLAAADPATRLLITGGDAERLQAHLDHAMEFHPRLVLDGMRRIAEAREEERRTG
ncbi:MAG: type III pantothenate kinase [Gammaproteobacteria bacterium]|nr:type III pantothenate kinase [Gammaproteobacteria bacterium]